MNIDKSTRLMVLLGYGDRVRSLLLNEPQINLLKMIGKQDSITSVELSKKYKISVQSAASKLKTLYVKGYLNRVNVGCKSGGDEFEYSYIDLME